MLTRSYAGLSIIGTSIVQNHCLRFVYMYFISTTLGEGVEETKRVFEADLEPKMTIIISATMII